MPKMTLNKNGLEKLAEYLSKTYPGVDIVVEDYCIRFGDLDVEFVAQVMVEDSPATQNQAVVEPNPASMSGNTLKPMGIPDPASVKAPVKAAEVIGKVPGSDVKAVGRAGAMQAQRKEQQQAGTAVQAATQQAFERLSQEPGVDQLTMQKAFSRIAQELKKPMVKPPGVVPPSTI